MHVDEAFLGAAFGLGLGAFPPHRSFEVVQRLLVVGLVEEDPSHLEVRHGVGGRFRRVEDLLVVAPSSDEVLLIEAVIAQDEVGIEDQRALSVFAGQRLIAFDHLRVAPQLSVFVGQEEVHLVGVPKVREVV